jgi:hypothetical protein
VFQSRTLWNELLAAGLVDELYLIWAPPCSAGGTPTFDAGRVHPLRLLSTRGRDGSATCCSYEVVGRDDDPGARAVLAVPGFVNRTTRRRISPSPGSSSHATMT